MTGVRGLPALVTLACTAIALGLLGAVLHEGVHALGHEPYTPSLSGQLLADGTRLPTRVSGAFLVVAVLRAWSLPSVEAKERFVAVTSGIALTVGGAGGLWIANVDLRHADVETEFVATGGHAPLVLAVSGAYLLGGASLLVPSVRSSFRAACGVAAMACAFHALLFTQVHGALRRFGVEGELPLPSALHGMIPVVLLVGVAVVGAVVLVSGRPWRAEAGAHAALLVALSCSAVLVLAAQMPFHHLCWHLAYRPVQRVAEVSVAAVTVIGVLLMAVPALHSHWKQSTQSKHCNSG